jgi:thiamine pyrophosphokinase
MAAIQVEDRDRGSWNVWSDGADAAPPAADAARVLVVLGGAGFEAARLRAEAARSRVLVAADGGAVVCLDAALSPDAVVGDFDSLPESARLRIREQRLHPSDDPGSNDLEKALAWITERYGGDGEIVLAAGASVDGGRMDHALANLGPLLREPHAAISLVDGEGRMFALRGGRVRLSGLEGRRVSVLPWSLVGATVSERGVRYPLERERLRLGGRGVSNEITSAEAVVELHEGVALVWVEA